MKKIFLFVLVLIFAFSFSGCCSSEKAVVNVKIEIDCSDILNNLQLLDEEIKESGLFPDDGKVLIVTEFKAEEGDNATDVLKKICAEQKIPVDDSNGYVKGINGIYEKSCGDMSGWVYEVNNEPIMTEYIVSEGDLITWKYVCDFSKLSFE